MVRCQALVDYQRFRGAKVAILVDISKAETAFETLSRHGAVLERLVATFSAQVLLVEAPRLSVEEILEQELADAWILLVAEGPSRALATRKNPQRINVEAKTAWEPYAFREIIRQVKESTQILESVTSPYRRFPLPGKPAPGPGLRPGTN